MKAISELGNESNASLTTELQGDKCIRHSVSEENFFFMENKPQLERHDSKLL